MGDLVDVRETARSALVRESMFHASDCLVASLEMGSLSVRCSAVRSTIKTAIEHGCERDTLTALCRLYIAEQEAADGQ